MDGNMGSVLLPACFLGLYLILEAADWGLCLAAPILGRTHEERRAVLRLMRPCLDGNELWFFMGLYMMISLFPEMQGHSYALWAAVLVGVGALLRMGAVLFADKLAGPVAAKILSGAAVVILAALSMVGTSLLREDGAAFTAMGVTGAIWMLLACFQVGTLYGAVKAVNPLAERCRAASLVSSVLSVVVYLIFAVLLWYETGDAWTTDGTFWMCLIATALLFSASFFLTRSRHAPLGLAAAYASAFFAIVVYFSAYVTVLPIYHHLDTASLRAAMSEVPGTVFLAAAVVWSGASFLWRMMRKKETYHWEDHI